MRVLKRNQFLKQLSHDHLNAYIFLMKSVADEELLAVPGLGVVVWLEALCRFQPLPRFLSCFKLRKYNKNSKESKFNTLFF